MSSAASYVPTQVSNAVNVATDKVSTVVSAITGLVYTTMKVSKLDVQCLWVCNTSSTLLLSFSLPLPSYLFSFSNVIQTPVGTLYYVCGEPNTEPTPAVPLTSQSSTTNTTTKDESSEDSPKQFREISIELDLDSKGIALIIVFIS